jgi:stringent starvation protein B
LYKKREFNPMSLPAKKDVARALLLRGSVFVHLDPRKEGVSVPTRLRLQSQVVLQVGLDMPVPIPDLSINDSGVYGTLSFKGVPFTCSIPWSAVFALVGDDAKGMVWSTEMPAEIAAEVEKEQAKKKAEATPLPKGVTRLQAREKASRPAGTVKNDKPALARPNHLKVVK